MSTLILYLSTLYFISISGEDMSPSFVISKSGESVLLKCPINGDKSLFTWYKIVGDVSEMKVGLHNKENTTTYDNWCQHDGCMLRIKKASKEMVGMYECKSKEKNTDEHLSVAARYELFVGDLSCHQNFDSVVEVVGQNDCQAVPQDTLVRACTLTYHGNRTYYPPLSWQVIDGHAVIKQSDPSQLMNLTREAGANVWKLETTSPVEVDNVGASFVCSVAGSDQTCSHKHPTNILFVQNKTASQFSSNTLPTMTPSNKRSVMCQVNKNDLVQCTYKWIHRGDRVKVEYEGALLNQDKIKTPGSYECLAYCRLKNHPPENCVILAERFEFQETAQASIILLYIVPIIVVIIILLIVFLLFLLYKRRRSKNSKKNGQVKEDTKKLVELEPLATTQATTTMAPTTTTQATTKAPEQQLSTPMPQSRPPLHNASHRLSFKRSSSNRSLMEKIKEEGGEPAASKRPVTINDSKGSVIGVGVMGGRIYCVCSDSAWLFVYHEDYPHNRLKPEEVLIDGMKVPKDLAVCPKTSSVFVCDYTEDKVIFRVYPKEDSSDNRICRGRVDGNPASISLEGADEETAVVVLKRNKRLHVEMYSTGNCKDRCGNVERTATWEKKLVFELRPEVKLPLKACVSVLPADHAGDSNRSSGFSANSRCLCLLYGSGRFNKDVFDTYSLAQYVLQTGRFLEKTFDLRSICANIKPLSMVTDTKRGGVCVLTGGSRASLWHLPHDFMPFERLVRVERPGMRFCLSNSGAVFGCHNNAFLVTKDMEPPQNPHA